MSLMHCPYCGAEQRVSRDPESPRRPRCRECGESLEREAIAAEPRRRSRHSERGAEVEEAISIERVPFPGNVHAAGIIWIVFGGLVLLSLSLVGLRFLESELEPQEATGLVCSSIFLLLFGAVFVHVGVQSVKGTAKDTIQNGIGSILFGVLYLGYGITTLNSPFFEGAEAMRAVAVGINLLCSVALFAAGILGIVGRQDYKDWRQANRPREAPSSSRRRP